MYLLAGSEHIGIESGADFERLVSFSDALVFLSAIGISCHSIVAGDSSPLLFLVRPITNLYASRLP